MVRLHKHLTSAQTPAAFSYSWIHQPMRPHALPPPLSKAAKSRLRWIDFCLAHGHNVSLTCRHFGIARSTLHRWLSRYDPRDLSTLEDCDRAPRRRRTPTTATETIDAILSMRDSHPEWSKYKLSVALKRDVGVVACPSTVGRVLSRYGRISAKKSTTRRRAARQHWRKRRPKQFEAKAPGDLVRVDTKHLHHIGSTRYQLVAVDVATRFKVSGVSTTASSKRAAEFVLAAIERMPFQVRAVQTDNGSEFAGSFHTTLLQAGVEHYFNHPHNPKGNAYVERAIRTDVEEFYDMLDEWPHDLAEHADLLVAWDRLYNEIRPHQSLGYLTPAAYNRSLRTADPSTNTVTPNV